MTRKKIRNEPTGIELFLYWWEVSGQEGVPQKNTQLSPYDEEFRKWLNGWKPRQTFFNVCRQAARRSVGSLITPSSHILVFPDTKGVYLDQEGTALVENWLNERPRNDRTPIGAPPVVKHTEEYVESRTVHASTRKHPVGASEMIGVVGENYRRMKPVASYTEGFRDGAEWVLSMDPATLKYLRGELTDD